MDKLHASEIALVSCSVNCARLNGARCEEGLTDIKDVFFYSRIFGFACEKGREKEAVEELKRAIEKGEKPNNIMVYAEDLTPELEAALIACGFENYASQTSMSLPLPVQSQPRAEIVPIDSDTIADWTNTLNEAMGVGPSPVSFYANLLPSDDAVLYGIRDNGQIVSTLMVCFFDGLPCIHECSTLPETRGKGYVSDLVRAACIEASRRGYDTMYLQASAMGEPVYAKLGFQPDGTIRHWKLG